MDFKIQGRFIYLLTFSFLFLSSLPLLASTPFRINVLYWSMNIPGQVAMRKGLEQEAQNINQRARSASQRPVKLQAFVAGDGETGIENQIKQMYQAIQQNPDLIIIQPTDNAALSEPLKLANRKQIPVVAYDQYISGGKLHAYVTSDNYQAGYLDGEYIASLFDEKYVIKLILVEYPHVSSTVERLNGFLDALTETQQAYKILTTLKAVEPVSGQQAGKNILKAFPEKGSVDVVFTVNDGGGLPVVDVLAEAGRDEIIIASIDGDPSSVNNIRQHRLTRIDSAQFCGPMGAEAMRIAYKILQNKKVPAHVLIPTFPVTRESLTVYPGWDGPIPAQFRKPWFSRQPNWFGKIKVVK